MTQNHGDLMKKQKKPGIYLRISKKCCIFAQDLYNVSAKITNNTNKKQREPYRHAPVYYRSTLVRPSKGPNKDLETNKEPVGGYWAKKYLLYKCRNIKYLYKINYYLFQ